MNKEEKERRAVNMYFEDLEEMHRWIDKAVNQRWYYEALDGMIFRCFEYSIEGEAKYANMN